MSYYESPMLLQARGMALSLAFALLPRLNLREMVWRWHGLGMLQCEIDEQTRIHLWDPRLQRIPNSSWRVVHDHRFDLLSLIVHGAIHNDPWFVEMSPDGAVPVWGIQYAKLQTGIPASDNVLLGKCCPMIGARTTHSAGQVYQVPRQTFHATRVQSLVITLVYRSNFSDQPARVLGTDSDMVEFSGIVQQEVKWSDRLYHDSDPQRVLEEAGLRLVELRSPWAKEGA